MLILVLGLVLFIGGHLVTRARGVRSRLVARVGEPAYKGAYALITALGLALILLGWRYGPFVPVWDPPGWTRHIPITLMWPAFVLLVATYLPGHIRAKLKHPMLVAVKLWASAHLVANGDLKSILLFGSFLAWAVIARIGLKRQERREGRAPQPASWQNDVVALVIGTVLYGLFGTFLHPILIGVPAFRF
ncbi:NnrU family protein [Hansschlegelia quercus]|uniref:NnrU family protein n=1 Tax=Hansschlegelia quercus TaxID=2528245 RepID=A0A4Q9GK70_9HYPH|nr:NnrU family protein [Hansschlegelia quercus]TBN54568.1 NnrU family protein [Hansschlegelia quercus]